MNLAHFISETPTIEPDLKPDCWNYRCRPCTANVQPMFKGIQRTQGYGLLTDSVTKTTPFSAAQFRLGPTRGYIPPL